MADGEIVDAAYMDNIPIVRSMSPIFVDRQEDGEHKPLLALVCTTDEGGVTLMFDLDTSSGAALVNGQMAQNVKDQAETLGFTWSNEVDSD